MKKRIVVPVILIILFLAIFAVSKYSGENPFINSAWALLPSAISISLALVTKEVYSSLFIGTFFGALMISRFNMGKAVITVLKNGILQSLTDSGKMSILMFVIILGIMVKLVSMSGGSDAFGKWVSSHIKSRVGLQILALFLGVLFFIDDGFSCFTTGSIMKPVCDKNKISRAKLAYIIDATAAPVCIIAPVSSWAAAVTGYVGKENGLKVFIRAIPYNFYAILSIVMIIVLAVTNLDFGKMADYEKNILSGENTLKAVPQSQISNNEEVSKNGRVIDLVLPMLVLIVSCVVGMVYTGGFFKGTDFITAVSNSDAPLGFVYGSSVALIFTVIYYFFRKLMSFKEIMSTIPEGFKLMVAPMIILVFAWALKYTTGALGVGEFIGNSVSGFAYGFKMFLPAAIFVIGALLSFATGTSWGTFGLLIPITLEIFPLTEPLGIVSLSASMAGAVFGDHCSPISDTTIMASAGAQCDHVVHTSTQLPYALVVAAVSFVGYIISGFLPKPVIVLPLAVLLLAFVLFVIKKLKK